MLDCQPGVDCEGEGKGEAQKEGGERDCVAPREVGCAVDAGEEGVC